MTVRIPYFTLDEWERLPEADPDTGGCPSCGGRHYGIVQAADFVPPTYRCHGTEWPNALGLEPLPPCGTVFRGRPFDGTAERVVCAFIARFA